MIQLLIIFKIFIKIRHFLIIFFLVEYFFCVLNFNKNICAIYIGIFFLFDEITLYLMLPGNIHRLFRNFREANFVRIKRKQKD